MKKTNSRQRVTDYLKQHKASTSSEISLALGVGAADIRHHLAVLVRDGVIQSIGTRPASAAGRPEKIYSLSDSALGDKTPTLADILLSEAISACNPDQVRDFMQNLSEKLYPIEPTPANIHYTKKLALLVEFLNKNGYSARWEAQSPAPLLILEHCPFSRIIQTHPELCTMDEYMLQVRSSGRVEQLSRLEVNSRGLPFCSFRLWGQ